jgi:hypothetical protein
MKPAVYILRLCLGAAICGALAGILGGAVIGVIAGLVARNAALGLDAAFWGGVGGAGLGALYGLGLGVADSTAPSAPNPPQPSELRDMASSHSVQAGR